MLDVPVHVVWQIISDAVGRCHPKCIFSFVFAVAIVWRYDFLSKEWRGDTRLWLVLAIYWNWRKAKREHKEMPLWSSLSIKKILLQSTYFLIPSIMTKYIVDCDF